MPAMLCYAGDYLYIFRTSSYCRWAESPVDRWRCVYRADNYVEGYSGAYSVEYYYGVLCTEYGVQSSSTPIRDPTEGRNYKKNRIREIKHRAAIRIG